MNQARILDIEKQIKNLRDKKVEAVDRYVELFHPLKPGDVVMVTGYGHKGKSMQVESIGVSRGFRDTFTWTAKGRVFKKDKTLGQQRAEWEQKVID